MKIFDYSFLQDGHLPVSLINLTAGIYSLKTAAHFRKSEHQTIYTELEHIARLQSVKSSNAIEGIITSEQRIVEIVNQNSAPLNHDEAEIAGYRDALNIIHNNYTQLDFRQRDILNLHRVLMSYAGDEFSGQYKKDDNVILEIDQQGQRRVRFRPTPATETPATMKQLELAYLDAKDNPRTNQLLLIPCVILDFLSIHPFRDGNGRMSRLLSLLLLYKNGFDVGQYISFEEQINKNKAAYYEALRQSSQGWAENANNYDPFTKNFISTLYICYQELDKRFAVIGDKRITKKGRVEATVLNSLVPISKSDIQKILPDVSPSTIEAVLGEMVRDGKITRLAMGRNARYIRR